MEICKTWWSGTPKVQFIEIGICYRATTDLIFHANKVTAHYKRLYEGANDMAKLTREQLDARRTANQQEALRSIAKTEQLNLRIDSEGIERLYEMSGKVGKPVGTMVREWITERLDQEEAGAEKTPAVALAIIQQKVSQLQQTLLPLKRPAQNSASASSKMPATGAKTPGGRTLKQGGTSSNRNTA